MWRLVAGLKSEVGAHYGLSWRPCRLPFCYGQPVLQLTVSSNRTTLDNVGGIVAIESIAVVLPTRLLCFCSALLGFIPAGTSVTRNLQSRRDTTWAYLPRSLQKRVGQQSQYPEWSYSGRTIYRRTLGSKCLAEAFFQLQFDLSVAYRATRKKSDISNRICCGSATHVRSMLGARQLQHCRSLSRVFLDPTRIQCMYCRKSVWSCLGLETSKAVAGASLQRNQDDVSVKTKQWHEDEVNEMKLMKSKHRNRIIISE